MDRKYEIEELKEAGDFLEAKGLNLENYTIFDTSGDFLQQIPIAGWLTEFAAQAKNKTSEKEVLPLNIVVASTFFFEVNGVNRIITEDNYTAACVKVEQLYPGQTWEYVCSIDSCD
jgi:hypothetical protein